VSLRRKHGGAAARHEREREMVTVDQSGFPQLILLRDRLDGGVQFPPKRTELM
jgi:hypothetical protein